MDYLLNFVTRLIKYWYIPLILGIILILTGFYTFWQPENAFLALSLLFSFSFMITGLGDMSFALGNRRHLRGWFWFLFIGILSFFAGAYLMGRPELSGRLLPLFIGFILAIRSFYLLGFSLEAKRHGAVNWGMTAFMSVLGILFSILLITDLRFAALSIVFLTGLSFLFTGLAYIMLSLGLKKFKNRTTGISESLKNRILEIEEEIRKETGE